MLYCTVSALLWVSVDARAENSPGGRAALLQSGESCPSRVLADRASAELGARGHRAVDAWTLAAAVARVRAARALVAARTLYTRTDFAGCVALLSITEQELGRSLGEPPAERTLLAHRTLGEVNLWLGVCQWAAGDVQAAAASFVRSSQLPSSPLLDGRLFPPELLTDYRRAVAAPREEVSCVLEEGLGAEQLLVNGKGPTVKGRLLQVPAGTHYVVIQGRCPAAQPTCVPGGGARGFLRLDARPLGCRVQRPTHRPEPLTCVSEREGSDASFVASVVREADARLGLVLEVGRARVSLRLTQAGRSEFTSQTTTRLSGAPEETAVLGQAVSLLLGGEAAPVVPRPEPSAGPAWYRRWWIWALVGTAAAVTVSAVALSARNDRVRVVFAP
ncbi:MAG: hypothetical protein IT371_19030 [Deltaproteobacteria bacterium]|nr:hypothetical protein [Deltaproteobacteria bacterium]